MRQAVDQQPEIEDRRGGEDRDIAKYVFHGGRLRRSDK